MLFFSLIISLKPLNLMTLASQAKRQKKSPLFIMLRGDVCLLTERFYFPEFAFSSNMNVGIFPVATT